MSREIKNKNLKNSFLISHLAYAYFGFGQAVVMWGVKGGLDYRLAIFILLSSVVLFFLNALTSMDKLKQALFKPNSEPNVQVSDTTEDDSDNQS